MRRAEYATKRENSWNNTNAFDIDIKDHVRLILFIIKVQLLIDVSFGFHLSPFLVRKIFQWPGICHLSYITSDFVVVDLALPDWYETWFSTSICSLALSALFRRLFHDVRKICWFFSLELICQRNQKTDEKCQNLTKT